MSRFPSAGRTPLFRAFARAMRRARFLAQHPELGSLRDEVVEIGAKARAGDGLARRELLKNAARVGLALPLAGAFSRPTFAFGSLAARSADPVAILGAGAGGLTAAYRLMQAKQPCELFEGSQRVGGRIFTLKDFNKEGQFCELGAELVDTNHTDMIELATELGVRVQELKEGDAGVELYHFGGKIYTEKDLLPEFTKIASQIAEDQGKLYEGEEENLTEFAKQLDQVSLREYLARFQGKCEPWVLDFINTAYCGEYGLETTEQTALNLLTYLDADVSEGFKIFGESDESKRIFGGNSSLMEALHEKLKGAVPVTTGHMLVKIEDLGGSFQLTFKVGAKTVTKTFARIICALPFTMLREVEGIEKLALTPDKLGAIQKLGYGTNVKVMYGFSERLWRTPAAGRPECNGSMYTSLPNQCFWETSRKQDGKSGILTNFLGGAQGTRPFDEARWKEAFTTLDAIIPGLAAKHDGNKRSWVWPTYAFSKGAYSCPKVGQYTTIWQATGTAELGGRMHFIGEHTSADFGGFMNGAIETANRAVKEMLAGA